MWKAHRDLIAVVLLAALLFPSVAPLLGAPDLGSTCGCQGDSCCLLHGRPSATGASSDHQPSHGDHQGGHGDHQSGHGGPGSQSPTSQTSDSAEPTKEGADCHLPGSNAPAPKTASSKTAPSKTAVIKLAAACGAGSPAPAPIPVRRDAITRLDDGGHVVTIVNYGVALARQRSLPASYLPEPPTPPPRSA